MSWWVSSLDLESTRKYNLAARWLLRQSGVVRQRGEEFLPEELSYKPAVNGIDPEDGSTIEIEPEDLLFGLNKLLKALETINGKTDLDKKGELRSAFYLDLKRRPGERIGEFCTRYRTLVADLRAEGINLPSAELGWFLREKLGLDSLRKQLLETALAGKDGYEEVESEVLRLFKELHTADPLHRRALDNRDGRPTLMRRFLQSSSGSGTTSSGPSSSRGSMPQSFRSSTTSSTTSRQTFRSKPPFPSRQAMATEAEVQETENEEAGGEEELIVDEEAQPGHSLEEVLQAEAEQLASDLQELEAGGCEPELLEELESGVETAAEALVSMREARARINDVKKDRGYGKAGTPKPAAKPHGNQVNNQKKVTRCFDCDQLGHWAGDKSCTRPGAGLGRRDKKGGKQVMITEVGATDPGVGTPLSPVNETMMVNNFVGAEVKSLSEALASTQEDPPEVPLIAGLARDKMLVGALDTACNRTVTGMIWLKGFLEELKHAPQEVQSLVKREDEVEMFRFGNGGVQKSVERWRLPMMVGNTLFCFWTSVVRVPSLGLLLGRDFLDGIGAVLSFTQRLLRCDHLQSTVVPLRQMSAGHFLLQLIPSAWCRPLDSRWRRVGQDGVIELQITASDWVRRKFGASRSELLKEHEHLVTEHSIMAADVSHSGLVSSIDSGSLRPMARDAMTVTATSKLRSTSSSTRTCCRNGKRNHSQLQASSGATVEKVCGKARSSFRLAHPGYLALVVATAYASLGPTAVPIGGKCQDVDRAIRKHGEEWHSTCSTPPTCSGEWKVHNPEPSRWSLPSESSWTGHGILGGPDHEHGYEGSKKCERDAVSHQSRSNGRCKEASSRGEGSRSSRTCCTRASRTQRWLADLTGRLAQIGGSSQRGAGGKGNSGTDQAGSTPHGQVDGRWIGPQRPISISTQTSTSTTTPGTSSSTTTDLTYNHKWNRKFKPRGPRYGHEHHEGGQQHDELPRATFPRDVGPGDVAHDVCAVASFRQCDLGATSGLASDSRDGCRDGRVAGLLSGRGCSDECGPRRVHEGPERGLSAESGRAAGPRFQEHGEGDGWNQWILNQELKKGTALQISEAWKRHVRDRELVSKSSKEVLEVLEADWSSSMVKGLNETFVCAVELGEMPLVAEVFTSTQRVQKEAMKRGHRVGTPMSLETGFDFLREDHRIRAKEMVKKEKPFFLVIAFPCNPWSALLRLNKAVDLNRLRGDGLILVRFAIELAELQLAGGRHYLLENPRTSEAWQLAEMKKFVNEQLSYEALFDQCRFNLRGQSGLLHKKATKVISSSSAVRDELHDRRCLRDHLHEQVIGGSRVTRPAGHYPGELAKSMVKGMEKQFHRQFVKNEVNVIGASSGFDFEEDEDEILHPGRPAGEFSDSDEELKVDAPEVRVSAGLKAAIKRLHENTGHRSNIRLARALAISGAPPQVVYAAKNHKCSVCAERANPKARRPASLPVPKDAGDQANIDLVEVFDAAGNKFMAVHVIDFATRFQMAELLPVKSTAQVLAFLRKRWLPVFGAPRVLVADQGREFVSWEFEEFCSAHSILLWHCGVGAPWQNGICERAGGSLKVILAAIVASHQIIGPEQLEEALGEAVSAYNSDINEAGVSPAQAAIGRQPKMLGDVLGGGFVERLAEHSLVNGKPSWARQVALRETAKVAMTRLHFSRSIRKAEIARSRSSTVEQTPEAGSIVYFWRAQKYNSKTAPAKRRLLLKRWHGPSLVVAKDGPNLFLSFKGQLTKCPAEHVRLASSLEQIAASTWRDAIEEAVESALQDMTVRGIEAGDGADTPAPEGQAPETPRPEVGSLPPLGAEEMVSALAGAAASRSSPSTPFQSSTFPSRRLSSVAAPGTPRRLSGVRERLQPLLERARGVDEQSGGEKRPPDVTTFDLHQQQQEQSHSLPSSQFQPASVLQQPSSLPQQSTQQQPQPFELDTSTTPPMPTTTDDDTLMVEAREILEASAINNSAVHPLFRVQAQAMIDQMEPTRCQVHDHGTWDGRWPLPMVSDWKTRHALGLPWPSGRAEFEVDAVQSARKEHLWRNMSPSAKEEFKQAAIKGWEVWVQNDAVEVLSEEDARRVRLELQKRGETHKILTPRYVYTDKHDGLRTEGRDLPLLASARLVVPGFRDVTAYQIRKDAPTAARISQHLILILTSSYYKNGWRLWSADIKSAFLKGDPYMAGARELYVGNIRTSASDEPTLPFGPAGLAKVRKGVFGLADAPRQWYLRLNRSLVGRGWCRSMMDAACWFLWSPSGELDGVICSHVDDLLLGGGDRAQAELKALGEELGFGSIEQGSFQYCGKKIHQDEAGVIRITMREYHENLRTVTIPTARRKNPNSLLCPAEHKQLRAILGSLQWLVAQLRFDMGFQLSVLQGDVATVGTLMKANQLVKKFQENKAFALTFKPLNLAGSGLLVVADASLGNVCQSGGVGDEPMERVFSQASYFVLVADAELLAGREGDFAVLDARSHRLARVCRSTFGAELYSTEEAFDVGIYCRGVLAEVRGHSLKAKLVDAAIDTVPLTVVTDAKDVFDKSTSDTPSYGSQKSLSFTITWLRHVLRRDNTHLRWTSTENMWVDAGTKEMDSAHIVRILSSCRWCTKYSPIFVKQTVKARKAVKRSLEVVGELVDPKEAVFGHLLKLGECLGWHHLDGVAVHVAKQARSFRLPTPRFEPDRFPLRSSYGLFELVTGQSEWRKLEEKVSYMSLSNKQGLIGDEAQRLVTFFHTDPSSVHKNKKSTENANM